MIHAEARLRRSPATASFQVRSSCAQVSSPLTSRTSQLRASFRRILEQSNTPRRRLVSRRRITTAPASDSRHRNSSCSFCHTGAWTLADVCNTHWRATVAASAQGVRICDVYACACMIRRYRAGTSPYGPRTGEFVAGQPAPAGLICTSFDWLHRRMAEIVNAADSTDVSSGDRLRLAAPACGQ